MSRKRTKAQEAEREDTINALRGWIKPGDTVYTVLNHVSRSGMSRSITPIVIKNNEPRSIAWSVAIIFGQSRDMYDGVTMNGCGMDMGFALVYSLSRCLFPEGFGLPMFATPERKGKGKTPKTKAEAAKLYALGYRAFGRNGDDSGWDNNGGYALKQRWL